MQESVDIMAVGAHPDDVELWAGGTVCSLTSRGYDVAIVDLTEGELGSRGTVQRRRAEAKEGAEIMGVSSRVNLEIPDGNIENTMQNRLLLIRQIRHFRPHTVLIGAPVCRHPDHMAATALARAAIYYSGLRKIETAGPDGNVQPAYRPNHVLHYMQAIPFDPTVVVDVSDYWEQRGRAVRAFGSQFFSSDYEPAPDEPETYVSTPEFLEWIEARARTYGYPIGARYGEPFLYHNGPVGVEDLGALLSRRRPIV